MDSSSCLWELQQAMYKVLASDATLLSCATGVHDGIAPTDARYPYVILGEATEGNSDRLSNIGRNVTVTIHVYSNYRGDREAKIIGNRVMKLLDRVLVTMASWNNTLAAFDSGQTFMESEAIRHSVIRMRYLVSPKAA